MLFSYVFLLLMVSVGIGYFSLLERKILSSIHYREGPEKSGFLGLFQPLYDGGKLFSKGINIPIKSDYFIFLISPIMGLMMCLFMWMLMLNEFDEMNMHLGFLFMLCVSSINGYVMILGGWSSNSMYGMIGSYRGIAQAISYEVVMILLMVSMMSVVKIYFMKEFLWEVNMYMMYFLSLIVWLSIMLAETNRSPYDFMEGESELVSGFNVEYSSINFSMLFMSEYGMIMFMCYLGEMMFWGSNEGYMMSVLMIIFIWIRGVLPRFRYDKLMEMVWKYYLFYVLCFFMFIEGLLNFFMI